MLITVLAFCLLYSGTGKANMSYVPFRNTFEPTHATNALIPDPRILAKGFKFDEGLESD